MSIKRILAFTGIRSDYDLLSGLYKKLSSDRDIELAFIVSGAHLSPTYGRTVQFIERDGFKIYEKIESLLDSDSPSSRLKSASILLQGCIHSVERFAPDVIMMAGDREDAMVAALAASYMGIPTIHFFGGDHSPDGNVDNQVRHAISKLASFHFVAHHEHALRLQRMGESKDRIFAVGSPALDKLISEPVIKKEELVKLLGRPEWDRYAVVIFHPILGDHADTALYFDDILTSLRMSGVCAFVSHPNVDVCNKQIINVIERYRDNSNFCFFMNLPRNDFVNLLRNAEFMIGNSSAGLYEAPLLKLGVINVGLRQRGRLAADNVLFADHGVDSIRDAIDKVMSSSFKDVLKHVVSPYGDGHSIDKCYDLIKKLDLERYRYKTEDCI